MTVDGVALGSLLASFLALGLAFLLYKKRYGGVKLNIKWSELVETEELKKFFSVNRDIVIRTLCLIFSYAFFTAKSAEMGDVVLAANTILLQMWYISSYGTDGFAYATESLVGRFKGAQDNERLKATIKANMLWGLGLGLLGTLTYAFFNTEIIALFTNKEEVIAVALSVVIWLIAAPLVNSVCFIWDGVYIGATATGAMRNSMLIATIVVFIPAYFISEPYIGIHALWLAMTAFMVARGAALTVYAPSRIFRPSKKQTA
jgi:MATE family multidrug resistance protein